MPVTVQQIGKPTDGKTIGQWVKEATIRAAETALMQEVARGFDNKPVVVTDGVPRRDYDNVRPFGRIEFIRRPQMAEAVLWALDMLRKRSPVVTGRYVQSHTVLLNGAEITGDVKAALQNVKEADRVQIVNPQPYAKKIEGRKARGKGRGANRTKTAAVAGLSKQAPRGVYERVVLPMLVQRYGRSMFFDFKYVKLDSGVKVKGWQGGGSARKRILRDHVYPSLHFFIKPTGLPN
jgi:hypothetical protein